MVAGGKHILHVFPGFDAGGGQMRTVQLMAMLPAATRHSILAMNGGYGCTAHVPPGVAVTTLPRPPARRFLAMGRFMADLLAEERPDAVFTYNWGSIEMVLGARRCGFAPLVHHEDGFGPEELDRYLRRRIWIRRWLLRSAAAVAVPSRVLYDLAATRWRVPSDRLYYLPNGVDLDRFRPGAERGGDALVIGSVARLGAEKNVRMLLEAFARSAVRNRARLRIYGDGPERATLAALAAALGIAGEVDFMGATADTAPVYREMDLFVLSSNTEQMPLTVLEAMASGLPLVATDVGDVRAMLDPSNHLWLCPRRDAGAMAAALDAACADAATRRAIGMANRARCEAEYDTHLRYRAWIDLYRSRIPGLGLPDPS